MLGFGVAEVARLQKTLTLGEFGVPQNEGLAQVQVLCHSLPPRFEEFLTQVMQVLTMPRILLVDASPSFRERCRVAGEFV